LPVTHPPEGDASVLAAAVLAIAERRTRPLFSLKQTGKWVMLGAGVLFISTVYYDPLLQFFVFIGLPLFFYCFVPLFSAGALILPVGYFVEKK
jgi:hypothetical protein